MQSYRDTASLAAGRNRPADECLMLNSQVHIAASAELSFGTRTRLIGAQVAVKDNARLITGGNCTIRGSLIVEGGGTVILGDDVIMTEPCKIRSVEGASIRIGGNSLFSSVTIYSGDYHGLYDEKGHRLNPPADVVIGSSVWIAMGAMVLKGSAIGDGAVVGAGSVVAGHYPASVVITGNPAKVVRNNVRWQRKPVDSLPDISGG